MPGIVSTERDVTVHAVMTAPRYECVSARNEIDRALQGLGIPLAISSGVYYQQCMQDMLERLCQHNLDYVITVDFDSVFAANDVQRLLWMIASDESIDAIAPLQPRRSDGDLMASGFCKDEISVRDQPVRARTAHFGLTVIDIDKLRHVPKPWFKAIPAKDGSWGEGRIDADVYFWKKWEQAGNSLYLDPETKIGHMEELVTYFDDEMAVQHGYLEDWRKYREVAAECLKSEC